MKVYP